MAIKKKSKVSAEFNMSSLTDIIFLLLIFFMLTSSMIVPNALNLQLPGKKNSSTNKPKTPPTTIDIKSNGSIIYNGTQMSAAQVERKIRELRRSKGSKAVLSVTPDKKASNDDFVRVMDMAYRHQVKTVLNDPR